MQGRIKFRGQHLMPIPRVMLMPHVASGTVACKHSCVSAGFKKQGCTPLDPIALCLADSDRSWPVECIDNLS